MIQEHQRNSPKVFGDEYTRNRTKSSYSVCKAFVTSRIHERIAVSSNDDVDVLDCARDLEVQLESSVAHENDFVDSFLRLETLHLVANRIDLIVENQVPDSHCKIARTCTKPVCTLKSPRQP